MQKIKRLIAKLFDKTFLRFVLVGIVNTLFGYAIMFAFYNLLHLSYWVSSACNYIFGSILSYFLNKRFTFRDESKSAMTVLRFAVNIAVCYLIAYGAARPFVRWLLQGKGQSLVDNAAMLTGSVVFVALNYLSQRFLTFRQKREDVPEKEQEER